MISILWYQFLAVITMFNFLKGIKIYHRLTIMFIGFLFGFNNLAAQPDNYRFKSFNIDHGLSSNTVHSIIQDEQGFIWFGTEFGLNRFDGYSFRTFFHNPSDSTSISDNWIWELFLDSSGKIWIGTNSGGLNLYDPKTGKFKYILHDENDPYSLSSNNIRAITEDDAGNIWVGTHFSGLNLFDKEDNNFIRFVKDPNDENSISGNQISTLFSDSYGNLWIGTYENGLNLFNKKENNFIRFKSDEEDPNSLSDDKVLSIYEDNERNLWIGTSDGILNKFNRRSNTFTKYTNELEDENHSVQYQIAAINEIDNNKLWIGTINLSLLVFDKTNKSFQYVAENPQSLENFNSFNVISIIKDRSNNFWFGTTDNGVYYLNVSSTKFNLLQHNPNNPENSLSYNTVRSVMEDSNGNLWVGTLGGGLNRYNFNTHQFTYYLYDPDRPKSLQNNGVTALLEDSEKNIWVGTWAGGLHKLVSRDPSKKDFLKFINIEDDAHSIRNDIIKTLTEDKYGRIWVGTEDGLDLFDKKNNKFYHIPTNENLSFSLSNKLIQAAIIDRKNNLWIATWDGLNKIDLNKNPKSYSDQFEIQQFYYDKNSSNSLSDNRIISLYEDTGGNIWAGTYGGGLNRISFENNEINIKRFTTNDGLPNNIIFGIEGDRKDNIWIATNKGLARLNSETNRFNVYNKGDGLQGNSFYWGAYHKGEITGNLYFGGLNGLTFFQSNEILDNNEKPEVVITGFKKFNMSYSFDRPIPQIDTIIIDHSDNFITFEFAALDFTNPNKLKYEYKMAGFDKSWRTSGTNRSATYTNLDPGKYIFKVRSSNSDGIWNEKGKSITLIIKPPFWATWWFRLFSGIFALVLVYLMYKRKISDIKLHNFELLNLNTKLKNEIKAKEDVQKDLIAAKNKAEASDNLKTEFLAQISHEIRTPVNTMLSFAGLLQSEIQDKIGEDLAYGISALKNSGNRILRTMDLIINMSEVQAGTYEPKIKALDIFEILKFIHAEFQPYAKDKNIDFKLKKDTNKTVIYIDEYSVHQIFNNLIDNAIKFTDAGKIELSIFRTNNNLLAVSVKDTGIGISHEYQDKLFTAFSQEEQGYTRRYEGNGLGLAITNKFAELNNAEILVQSEKGKGSTFTVVFKNDLVE